MVCITRTAVLTRCFGRLCRLCTTASARHPFGLERAQRFVDAFGPRPLPEFGDPRLTREGARDDDVRGERRELAQAGGELLAVAHAVDVAGAPVSLPVDVDRVAGQSGRAHV